MKKVVSIGEASKLLRVSKEAIRKRIARGSIEAEKDDNGHWQVTVYDIGQDTGRDTGQGVGGDTRALIEHLQRENEQLWQELYRKDTIIMNLSENVKLLSAPPKRQTFLQRLFGRGGNSDNV